MDNQPGRTPQPVDLELLVDLERPDIFQRLVDSLPPSPTTASLRLWGVLHGVYTLSDSTQRQTRHEPE
ncbi:MAG TPA: hypothetical protein VJY65_03470 [Chloroflexota bacterium]|nr:hypothetical protein [Chloroflexota bacterium]